MMQEITKLVEGETYEVRWDAGFGDGATAQVISATPEGVHLEVCKSGDVYEQIRIANEDAEIEAYLNIVFIPATD